MQYRGILFHNKLKIDANKSDMKNRPKKGKLVASFKNAKLSFSKKILWLVFNISHD